MGRQISLTVLLNAPAVCWESKILASLSGRSEHGAKHLTLCQIERRSPRLDLSAYPFLPGAEVKTTAAGDIIPTTEWLPFSPALTP
jgi:hypothetical protein